MTTPAQIRKAALSLPEVTETASDGSKEFSVRGVIFATVSGKGAGAILTLHPDTLHPDTEADANSTDAPQGIALGDLNGMESNHWVRQAWLAAAPDKLTAPLIASESAVAGEVGDLPKAIGNPATKALVAHGITSLSDLAEVSLDDVADWHGVGAKAVDILRESLGR
jgi:hypothetical protein